MERKIKSQEEIIEIAKNLKSEGKLIVTTNGCFDILHAAHVRLFNYAKEQGDALIVLLNSDASVKKNKGDKRPIVNQNERAYMIASLEAVDYVVIFNEESPLGLLKEIKPSIHVKGSTSSAEKLREEKEIMESWGAEYRIIPEEKGKSTTRIIEQIISVYSNKP